MVDGVWQMTLRNGVVHQAWLFPSTATSKLQAVICGSEMMAQLREVLKGIAE